MKKFPAALLLSAATFFWGVSITIVKQALAHVDVYPFLFQRFLIASVVMLPLAFFRRKAFSLPTLAQGIVLGCLLFAAFALQTVGVQYTSASNAGFLTGLNVVLVPVFGALFFGQPIARSIRWGVCLAVAGLVLLCSNGTLDLNRGDGFATLCGASVALHIIFTARFANRAGSDVYLLTTLQLCTVGVLSLGAALLSGTPPLIWHPEISGSLAVCALLATVFAFLVQTSMQRHISPAHTALIFCMEPVFGAGYAYLAAGERLTGTGYLGAVLILAGMLVSELLPDQGAGAGEEPRLPAEVVGP